MSLENINIEQIAEEYVDIAQDTERGVQEADQFILNTLNTTAEELDAGDKATISAAIEEVLKARALNTIQASSEARQEEISSGEEGSTTHENVPSEGTQETVEGVTDGQEGVEDNQEAPSVA